ncbi:MAG TPA: hypothetical protein VF829_02785 [Candidatus Paceibacterota bacterium]
MAYDAWCADFIRFTFSIRHNGLVDRKRNFLRFGGILVALGLLAAGAVWGINKWNTYRLLRPYRPNPIYIYRNKEYGFSFAYTNHSRNDFFHLLGPKDPSYPSDAEGKVLAVLAPRTGIDVVGTPKDESEKQLVVRVEPGSVIGHINEIAKSGRDDLAWTYLLPHTGTMSGVSIWRTVPNEKTYRIENVFDLPDGQGVLTFTFYNWQFVNQDSGLQSSYLYVGNPEFSADAQSKLWGDKMAAIAGSVPEQEIFTQRKGNGVIVWLLGPDNVFKKVFTTQDGYLSSPVFSPDRTKAVFTEPHGGGQGEPTSDLLTLVYTADIEHARLANVSSARAWVDPDSMSWSPDGAHLAYLAVGPVPEIDVVDVSTGNVLLRTPYDGTGRLGYPTWRSSDEISYFSGKDLVTENILSSEKTAADYSGRIRAGNPHAITTSLHPIWSSDARFMAHWTDNGISISDTQTGSSTLVKGQPSTMGAESPGETLYEVGWANDTFFYMKSSSDFEDLYSVDMPSGVTKKYPLLSFRPESLSFSPDMRYVSMDSRSEESGVYDLQTGEKQCGNIPWESEILHPSLTLPNVRSRNHGDVNHEGWASTGDMVTATEAFPSEYGSNEHLLERYYIDIPSCQIIGAVYMNPNYAE